MMAAPLCALIVILWWLLFSRARWYERLGALALMIAAMFPEKYVVHPSIAGGAMGNLSYILVIPTLSLALVGWAVLRDRVGPAARSAAVIVAVLLGCLPWMLVRTGGITASGKSDFHWRWTKTPEEQLLAQAADEPKPAAPAPAPSEISTPAASPVGGADQAVIGASSARARTSRTLCTSEACRVAWFSRTRSRQRDSRRADRDRLVAVAAGSIMAAPDRTRLVVFRRQRQSLLHAGAARRRRDRLLLPDDHRRSCLAASRRDAVLGIERRRRPARNADAEQRSRLQLRRNRNSQRARRNQRRRGVVAQRAHPTSGPRRRCGASRVRRSSSAMSSSSRRAESCRVRPCDGHAALDRRRRRPQLQLAAPREDRRRRAGPVHERTRHDQRCAGHRQSSLGVRLVRRRDRSAGSDRRRRCPRQHRSP